MTEFREALEKYDELGQAASLFELGHHNHTIRRALLIADRLTGNQSQETIQAGIDSYNKSGPFAVLHHFKAMRDQLIKEIEQGSKCRHEGYSFKEHGRCCPQCGESLTDFGD